LYLMRHLRKEGYIKYGNNARNKRRTQIASHSYNQPVFDK
jgi:hypothetical protein